MLKPEIFEENSYNSDLQVPKIVNHQNILKNAPSS